MSEEQSRGIRQWLRPVAGVLLAGGFAVVLTIALRYVGQGGTRVDPAELEKAHTTFGLVTVPLLMSIVTVVVLFVIYIHTQHEPRD